MDRYNWVITKDHIGLGGDKGIIGPRSATKTLEQIKKEGDYFQMVTCDGELYYDGYICGDYEGFEPLDDFGMPNAGCTDIRYRNKETNKMEII
jgi:hypothetical protein